MSIPFLQPYIKLQPGAQYEQICQMMGRKVFDLNQRGDLFLMHGQYTSKNFKKVLKKIKIMNMIHLYFGYNFLPPIVKELTVTSFPILQNIHLSGNSIESLESLQLLQAPRLQRIVLYDNVIVSVTSLKKSNFPELIELQIEKNKIECINSISQWNFPNLQMVNFSQNVISSQDTLVKNNFNRLQKFFNQTEDLDRNASYLNFKIALRRIYQQRFRK